MNHPIDLVSLVPKRKKRTRKRSDLCIQYRVSEWAEEAADTISVSINNRNQWRLCFFSATTLTALSALSMMISSVRRCWKYFWMRNDRLTINRNEIDLMYTVRSRERERERGKVCEGDGERWWKWMKTSERCVKDSALKWAAESDESGQGVYSQSFWL